MQLKAKELEKALTEITATQKFVLKNVSPIYVYEDGKRTDKIAGFRYSVADPATFDNFNVKVAKCQAIITNDMLENNGVTFVTFENAVVKPYKLEYAKVLCTVTADNVKLVEA